MSNAGTGAAEEVNKEILKNNTLLASIEMPSKLFTQLHLLVPAFTY